jgi:hypothetical protein
MILGEGRREGGGYEGRGGQLPDSQALPSGSAHSPDLLRPDLGPSTITKSGNLYQGSFFWLQNTEGLTLVGVFMEGTTLTC